MDSAAAFDCGNYGFNSLQVGTSIKEGCSGGRACDCEWGCTLTAQFLLGSGYFAVNNISLLEAILL